MNGIHVSGLNGFGKFAKSTVSFGGDSEGGHDFLPLWH